MLGKNRCGKNSRRIAIHLILRSVIKSIYYIDIIDIVDFIVKLFCVWAGRGLNL